MNKIQKQRNKSIKSFVSIIVLALAIYLGFTPLYELINEGVAANVVGASFSAIFAIILTYYLLNKQTEIEQDSKKGERVFEEKVHLYKNVIENCRTMYADGKISGNELSQLPFELINLQMMAADEIIGSYVKFFKKMNSIYSASEDEDVEFSDEDRHEIISELSNFAKLCRLDLGIEDDLVPLELLNETISVIEESSDALSGKSKSANAEYVDEENFFKKLGHRDFEPKVINLLHKMIDAIKKEFKDDKYSIDFVATSEKSTPIVSLKVACNGPARYSSLKISKKYIRIDAVPLMSDYDYKTIKISDNLFFDHSKKHSFDREASELTGVKKYFGGQSSNNFDHLTENEINTWVDLCRNIILYRESGKSKDIGGILKKAELGDESSVVMIETILSPDYFHNYKDSN